MVAISKGLVAYTDGSSVPLPNTYGAGYGGSGVHGYYFHSPLGKERSVKVGKWRTTKTGYQQIAGNADAEPSLVVVDKYYDACIPHAGSSTSNNVAEMMAALHVMKLALSDDALEYLHLLLDSKLVVDGIEHWVFEWERNGWKTKDGNDVKNKSIWESLHRSATQLRSRLNFSIERVKGHSGNLGNDYSDYNASVASRWASLGKYDESVIVEPSPRDYDKGEDPLHPLLNLKRLYFNSAPQYNERGVYYQTSWAGSEFILGKRSGETSYSVVILDEPDSTMDSVMRRSRDYSEHNIVMYARAERLKDPTILRYSSRYGEDAFLDDRKTKNIVFLDKKPVIHAVRPGELPLRAFDTLQYLADILKKTVRGTIDKSEEGFTVIDITEEFYDRSTKKVKNNEIEIMTLKKSFNVGFTLFKCNYPVYGHDITFSLWLGDDLPNRNQMKRIEVLNPVVQLVIWRETPQFVRYACVISIDGAVGIWSNYFSNQVVLRVKKTP